MSSPQLIWFIGMNEEEKARALQTLKASTALKEMLMKVLQAKYESVEKKGLLEAEYDDANWVFKQAFNNGRLSMLKEVADLFNFAKE